jgi:uncharacterized protein YqgC (DUF456 family)
MMILLKILTFPAVRTHLLSCVGTVFGIVCAAFPGVLEIWNSACVFLSVPSTVVLEGVSWLVYHMNKMWSWEVDHWPCSYFWESTSISMSEDHLCLVRFVAWVFGFLCSAWLCVIALVRRSISSIVASQRCRQSNSVDPCSTRSQNVGHQRSPLFKNKEYKQ